MQTYKEVWKDIPNYEGLYQVSNLGRVKSFDRVDASGRYRKGRFLSAGTDSSGYSNVVLCKIGSRETKRVHKLVMLSFYGKSSLDVNHINGIKTDNRIENLEYVTRSENNFHAYKTGLKLPTNGERHGNSKLNKQQVIEMRSLKGIMTYEEMALKYGVTAKNASDVVNKVTWKHI